MNQPAIVAFLNAYLLGGLILAGVPIIIHILNRRRFKRIDWAPMKYLKLTIKRNRRRLCIEQLILLAMRTLVVILIILAVARPVISPSALGSWLAGRGRTSRIIVLDDSLSMDYRSQGRSVFDRAKTAASQLLSAIGAQDAVTILTTSAPDAPLIKEAHVDDPKKIAATINALPVSDTTSDWPSTFRDIGRILASATFPQREIVLITDLRKNGWAPSVTDTANRWANQNVGLKVIDVGVPQTANVSLAGFDLEDTVALPGTIDLKAQVRNSTATAITGAQALLSIGEDTRPVLLPELPPNQTIDVPITINPTKPGQFPLHLTLPPDALPADDGRWLCLTVRPTINVTLVDGEPSAQPFGGETDFLALAFSVGSEPWHIRHVTDVEFNNTHLAPTDVLVLANVATISSERATEIERAVHEGMGLIVFCGDLVDPSNYNQRLYKNGAGLVPARIESPVDATITGIVIEAAQQSPLEPLSKLAPGALSRIRLTRFMNVTLPSNPQETRVLARWNNSESSPAIIEKRVGRGRVLLVTVTADRAWSDWPIDPTYVLAMRSAAMSIAKGASHQDNVLAGQPILASLADKEQALEPQIKLPTGQSATAQLLKSAESSPVTLRYTHTAQAGPYELSWKNAKNQPQSRLVCASPDKQESDLTPISDHDLTILLGALHPPIVHYNGQSSLAEKGKEIWRTLAIALLGLAVAETLFAVWVGRER